MICLPQVKCLSFIFFYFVSDPLKLSNYFVPDLPPQIQLTFGTCTKSTQPNSADSFHMEVCQNTHYLVVRIVRISLTKDLL